MRLLFLAPWALAFACSDSNSQKSAAAQADAQAAVDSSSVDAGQKDSAVPEKELVAKRPYDSHVPASYDGSKDVPLVVLLHGYTDSGAGITSYFRFEALSDERGFLFAAPDGTSEKGSGSKFWNASDACCNFGGSEVDDVAYVSALIADMSRRYRVDAKRVFVVGHSNGGFMAHRMACERSQTIAAIVSLAGAVYKDATKCLAASPISVLEVHGTTDAVIAYPGGFIVGKSYPSAKDTVSTWASKNGCDSAPTDGATPLDLVSTLPGSETQPSRHMGCRPGGAAELWTMNGAGHIPQFGSAWGPSIYDWLMAHPKP